MSIREVLLRELYIYIVTVRDDYNQIIVIMMRYNMYARTQTSMCSMGCRINFILIKIHMLLAVVVFRGTYFPISHALVIADKPINLK